VQASKKSGLGRMSAAVLASDGGVMHVKDVAAVLASDGGVVHVKGVFV
jgi:hypothetical protein